MQLWATAYAMNNQDFICSVCQSKYAKRPDGGALLKKVKLQKGCAFPPKQDLIRHRIQTVSSTIGFSTCIGNYLDAGAMQWLEAYEHHKRGGNIFQRGIMKESNKVIDILRICRTNDLRQEQIRVQKQNAKQRSRVGR